MIVCDVAGGGFCSIAGLGGWMKRHPMILSLFVHFRFLACTTPPGGSVFSRWQSPAGKWKREKEKKWETILAGSLCWCETSLDPGLLFIVSNFSPFLPCIPVSGTATGLDALPSGLYSNINSYILFLGRDMQLDKVTPPPFRPSSSYFFTLSLSPWWASKTRKYSH